MRGSPLGGRHHFIVDHQQPVVIPFHIFFHYYRTGHSFCRLKGNPCILPVEDIGGDPPPVVAADGLHHQGVFYVGHGFLQPFFRPYDLAFGNRYFSLLEQKFRVLLVTGKLHGNAAGLTGDGGLYALLVGPIPQLAQGVPVQPYPRDAPALGLFNDGPGAGPQALRFP